MSKIDDAVRTAAKALKKAIDEAHGAGYRVGWPHNASGLDAIAVSETARVKVAERAPESAVAKPATFKEPEGDKLKA